MERFSAGSSDVPSIGGVRLSPSGKEDISAAWLELHGSNNWVGLLDPLHPSLCIEILRYGTFAQATYDAYDFDQLCKYCGGYEVTSHLYATMTELPRPSWLPPLVNHWLKKSLRIDSWSEDSNWMGFIAVSDDEESRRLGRRNILVAWRGSMEPSEWFKDAQWSLESLGPGGGGSEAMVEHGFYSVYTSKSSRSRYGRSSASEQAMAEIRRLVGKYCGEDRKEVVSLTTTGHSLGGALALLNAHEAAAASIPGLSHVSVISFGVPKVGNAAFGDELAEKGVKVLRVVIKQDMVPTYPGHVVDSRYQHTGVQLDLDMDDQPSGYSLLELLNVVASHSMKTYLHLLEMKRSSGGGGFPLVNMPIEEREDPPPERERRYRMVQVGLLQGPPGWELQEREAVDVPAPPDDGDAPAEADHHLLAGCARAISHFLMDSVVTLCSRWGSRSTQGEE